MDLETEGEILAKELRKLNKSFSLHRSFIRGIVTGFGTAVGAGLLVALIAVIFQALTGLPIFGPFFEFLAGGLLGL